MANLVLNIITKDQVCNYNEYHEYLDEYLYDQEELDNDLMGDIPLLIMLPSPMSSIESLPTTPIDDNQNYNVNNNWDQLINETKKNTSKYSNYRMFENEYTSIYNTTSDINSLDKKSKRRAMYFP
ncbi:hypothetical protein K502DRAFT_353025 [Neoconidiobolus thromboides FSU 785]|nr:hypothetical protein K502DRAFT_353025 [Neoconidiobolus thromboides FSU 785]